MTEFSTEPVFEALRTPLGVIDNEERRSQIEAYIEAARPPLDQSVFDLLSQLSQAINDEVAAHYQIVLDYRQGVLDLKVRPVEPAEGSEEAWSIAVGDDVEKITLRLPAELKEIATQAAAEAGLSANSWFVRMLARSLRTAQEHESEGRRRSRRHRGRRLTGWIGPDA